MTDDEIIEKEERVSKLIAAWYADIDNLSDDEFNALPEDWEDQIVDTVIDEVWGSEEAYEKAVSEPEILSEEDEFLSKHHYSDIRNKFIPYK